MVILLINPPPYNPGNQSRFLERTPIQTYTMPLGLGYIASFLEKAGYDVSIIDAYARNLTFDEIERSIYRLNPNIIGISCLSDQRASWVKLIQLIRTMHNDIRIVLGGAHPTLMPEQTLRNYKPDAVVMGEGEETMLELVMTWENNGSLDAVKGIAFLKGDSVFFAAPRERITNLDAMPFPAYHLVDLDDYTEWSLLKMIFKTRGIDRLPKYASISTSRGCVGDCGYCSSPLIWKKGWTKRGAINVVDEMEMLNKKYNVEFIILTDDIFTVDQGRVISLCNEIIRRELTLLWGFETSVNFVSSQLLNAAKQAGCYCILYGIESGSKSILSTISKRIDEDKALRAFQMTKDAGIVSGAFLMVGNPGENEQSINETIYLLRKLKPDIILPQITMITPGTMVFNLAKQKGYIDDNYWSTDLPFPYYTCERKLKTLLRWYRKLYYYNHSFPYISLLTLRDYIELRTGIRINKNGFSRVEIPPN
jgi:radical SAM superfamily enzyme YgiQ (UPF0313 family)